MDYNNTIQGGIIHVHSENSLKDSAQKVSAICKRGFELGAQGIFLSDHGVMTGFEELLAATNRYQEIINCCATKNCARCPQKSNPSKCTSRKYAEPYCSKNATIKGIPSVEAYFEDDALFVKRAHVLLMPKDNIGLRAIFEAVTASNKNLDSQNMPRMNFDIFKKYFGEGALGHDHVICSSACMAGILSAILLANTFIEENIEKLEKKRKDLYNPNSKSYKKNLKKIQSVNEDIDKISKEILRLTPISKRPFVKKEKTLKSMKGKPEYEDMKARLDAEKKETEQSKDALVGLKKQKESLKSSLKPIKEACRKEEKDHEKWNATEADIQKLRSSISTESELYEKAKAQAKELVEIFGKGNFYAELQNHRIPQEVYVMPIIAKLANELCIPTVATNDAHMTYNTPEELKARQIMRSLRYNQWEQMSKYDEELFIKTDSELASILSEILSPTDVKKAMTGINDIVGKCNIESVNKSHYPVFKSPVEGETATQCLSRMAKEGIEWRYPCKKGWTKEHQTRMEYELEVIDKLGVSSYLCIVEDFLRYGRLLGKLDMENPDPRYLADPYNIALLEEITKNSNGVSIGPGRGSAVGSLVCYLTGITSVDPIKHELIFARFLNEDRVSMPDVDSDFRPDIRDKVLDYVKYKYGKDSVCCIMTRGTQQAKAAIRNCARLLGSELHDDTTTFLALGDEIAKAVPDELNIKLDDCISILTDKFRSNKNAMTIINNAKLVEGVFTNVGMHAAGVIIADNGNVSEYVPLMYIPGTEQFATQCDKDQCEGRGLLKMDFLGLRNLGIIDKTIRMVKERYGISVDIDNLPFESAVFKKIFGEAQTNSVFQFESGGMKQMLRQFKPENIEDIILLVAAYRPGPMQYLDNIIAVKHGKRKPDYVIPEMETVLGKTYGYPVYQEQIMTIFNKFAGFSLGEADIIRRYMSKKKTDKFMSYKDKFVKGMVSHGGKPEKVEEFWNQLVDFSKYAFNKSHAAAYAFVAYYTGWLKLHYPQEYLCAVMNDTAFEKLNGLIGDCKGFGIKIFAPDINKSLNTFSVTDESIVCGLGNVKNVGNAAIPIIEERLAGGPFKSFGDFFVRTKAKKDAVESLIYAGAFDSFHKNRNALVEAMPEYCELIKKIKEKEKVIESGTADETKLEKARNTITTLLVRINEIAVPENEEDMVVRLENEKNMLGAFISSHPLDSYPKANEIDCVQINDLVPQKYTSIMGMIKNLHIAHRKSDGAAMAFFQLEDQTGTIDVCCFAESYKRFELSISEDAVVKISGSCGEDKDRMSDEIILKIMVKNIEPLRQNKKPIIVWVKNLMDWTDNIEPSIRQYREIDGCPLVVYDQLTSKYRSTTYTVSKAILNSGLKVSM